METFQMQISYTITKRHTIIKVLLRLLMHMNINIDINEYA